MYFLMLIPKYHYLIPLQIGSNLNNNHLNQY